MSDKNLGASTSARNSKPVPAAVARTLDACHYLNVSRATLLRLVETGKLRPVKLGARAVGYRYTDLDAFLAAA